MLLGQIDRKQRYFKIENLHFPHWEKRDDPLSDTILDGELVIDIDPKTGAVSGRGGGTVKLIIASVGNAAILRL